MLKRFLSYYKPHKKMLTLDMLASLTVALLGIIYPIITRLMLNDYIPNHEYNMILILGSLLLVIYIIRLLLNYFIQYQGHVIGVKMQAQMRSDMFNHLQTLPFKFFFSILSIFSAVILHKLRSFLIILPSLTTRQGRASSLQVMARSLTVTDSASFLSFTLTEPFVSI